MIRGEERTSLREIQGNMTTPCKKGTKESQATTERKRRHGIRIRTHITLTQSPQRQVDNIRAFDPDMTILAEMWSERVPELPAYRRLKRQAKEGETIVLDSVSRMSS